VGENVAGNKILLEASKYKSDALLFETPSVVVSHSHEAAWDGGCTRTIELPLAKKKSAAKALVGKVKHETPKYLVLFTMRSVNAKPSFSYVLGTTLDYVVFLFLLLFFSFLLLPFFFPRPNVVGISGNSILWILWGSGSTLRIAIRRMIRSWRSSLVTMHWPRWWIKTALSGMLAAFIVSTEAFVVVLLFCFFCVCVFFLSFFFSFFLV
jgi:hypothetical protein